LKKVAWDQTQVEDYQKKGLVAKLQANTSQIEDAAVEKMDKLGATV
jgi:hypothetical protein